MSLYRKYRPRTLDEVLGQDNVVKVLKDYLRRKQLPHALLLSGPSGVGKTTIARILRRELHCGLPDFQEINAASARGIDTVRDIEQKMGLAPISGKCRMWLLDEAHRLTGDAQSSLLKMLEDTPRHCYFILATTDPHKVIKTIHTRCTKLELSTIADKRIVDLIQSVMKKETGSPFMMNAVGDKIVDCCEGSAREALVLLDKVIGLKTEEEMLAAIVPPEAKKQAWDLVKALLYEKTKWADVVKIIKLVDLSEPERFRHLVLACCRTELLKANRNAARAYMISTVFASPWYDCQETGLLNAAYEVCMTH